MSQNLYVAVQQDDGQVRPMVLTRVNAGLTHSAVLGIGQVISFDGLHCEIVGIIHEHQSIHGQRAPTTSIHGKIAQGCSDTEIEMLKRHGFEDL